MPLLIEATLKYIWMLCMHSNVDMAFVWNLLLYNSAPVNIMLPHFLIITWRQYSEMLLLLSTLT